MYYDVTVIENPAYEGIMRLPFRDVKAVISSIASAFVPIASTNKNEETYVDIFSNFCGSVACLLHFIILRRQKPIHILLLLYVLRLSLLFQTTLCLFFLDIRTCVECRTVLFNLFFIVEPLMYFRVCQGTPTNKNSEITICL